MIVTICTLRIVVNSDGLALAILRLTFSLFRFYEIWIATALRNV